jgi:hypothetical protein
LILRSDSTLASRTFPHLKLCRLEQGRFTLSVPAYPATSLLFSSDKWSRQSCVPLVATVHQTDQRWNGTGVPDGVTFRPFSISFNGCTFWGAGRRALQRAVTSLTGLGLAVSPTSAVQSYFRSLACLMSWSGLARTR